MASYVFGHYGDQRYRNRPDTVAKRENRTFAGGQHGLPQRSFDAGRGLMAIRMLTVDHGWDIAELFGGLNANIEAIERILDVAIELENEGLHIEGDLDKAEKAEAVLTRLIDVYEKGSTITLH